MHLGLALAPRWFLHLSLLPCLAHSAMLELLCACAGQDPAGPSPTEAATNTKHTSDLLRRFKELTVKEPKDPAGLDQPEIDLRVS